MGSRGRWGLWILCLACCSLARADFWVDPPPSTPLEWCRTEQPSYPIGGGEAKYEVGTLPPQAAPPKDSSSVEGYDKEAWEQAPTAKPNPTKKLLEDVRAPLPNRLMTADIWAEWTVTRYNSGWGNLDSKERLPPVPGAIRDKLLVYHLAAKAFPYYLPPREFEWYLTSLGWLAAIAAVPLVNDQDLGALDGRVLSVLAGQGVGRSQAACENWFRERSKPPPKLPPPLPKAKSLPEFVASWVRDDLSQGYWATDGHQGERLNLYQDMVRDEVLKASGEDARLVRWNAVGWMADLREPRLREPLRKLLVHPDKVVRIRAWQGLFNLQDKALEQWVDAHVKEADPLNRSTALYAAGVLGNPKRAGAVAEALEDKELGDTALVALARLASPAQGQKEKDRLRSLAVFDNLQRGRATYRALVACAGLLRLGDESGFQLLDRMAFLDREKNLTPQEFGTSSPSAWLAAATVPQIQVFLVDLAGRSPSEKWQALLRNLASSPPGLAQKTHLGSLIVNDELKGVAIQNLLLKPEDPLLEILEKTVLEKGNWFVRASALARLFEADRERGLAASRKILEKEEPRALEKSEDVKKDQDRARELMTQAFAALQHRDLKEAARLWPELAGLHNALADESRSRYLPVLDRSLKRVETLRREKDSEALAVFQNEARSMRDSLAEDDFKDAYNKQEELPLVVANLGRALTAQEKPLMDQALEALKGMELSVPGWPAYTGNATVDGDYKPYQPWPSQTAIEPVLDTALAIVRQDLEDGDLSLIANIAKNPARSDGLRMKMLKALAQPKGAKAAEAVLEIAKDASAPSLVRQTAILAWAAQGEGPDPKRLLPFLEDPDDGWVRFAAFTALRRITGKEFFCDWLRAPVEERAKAVQSWRQALES